MVRRRTTEVLEAARELAGAALSAAASWAVASWDRLRPRWVRPVFAAARRLEEMAVSKLPKRVRQKIKKPDGGQPAGEPEPGRGRAAKGRAGGAPVRSRGGGGKQPAAAGSVAAEPTAPVTPGAELEATVTQAAAPGAKRGAAATGTSGPERQEAAGTAGAERAAAAKLDLGPGARAERPVEHIPWSYGADRITAAAVDPERLYVYWEVTDDAIERARAQLGPGGAEAWLNLRVYDTTGLIFDGTNARSYFDHQVDRSIRQWFFAPGKPLSTAFVELGMKSREGYFAKIVRSGRVDFPRNGPAEPFAPEWMTVREATGPVLHAGTGMPSARGSRAGAPGPGAAGGHGGGAAAFAPIPLWLMHETAESQPERMRMLLHEGWERVEWREVVGEGWFELLGRVEWEGPLTVTTWRAGPFTHPVEVEPPSREEWRGRAITFKVGNVIHVAYGPWQVVIRNLGAHQSRSVIARWEIHRSWPAGAGREVRGAATTRQPAPGRGGASEIARQGASERLWLSGSELRLGGASELWRLGASELLFRGASETLFAGASQRMLAGASERRLLGASEVRLGGASERMLGGASERMLGGASERLGASERMLGGASERHLGASERRFLGGSESPQPAAPAGSYPTLKE